MKKLVTIITALLITVNVFAAERVNISGCDYIMQTGHFGAVELSHYEGLSKKAGSSIFITMQRNPDLYETMNIDNEFGIGLHNLIIKEATRVEETRDLFKYGTYVFGFVNEYRGKAGFIMQVVQPHKGRIVYIISEYGELYVQEREYKGAINKPIMKYGTPTFGKE